MITRRTALKWLHWLSLGILLYFLAFEPENVDRLGATALATHAGMGILLGILTTIWFTMFLRKGLASRPGPKLPWWAKAIHPIAHKALYFGLPLMVMTGALTGFAAPYAIHAFGLLPINPGLGARDIYELMNEIHELAFDALTFIVIGHAVFHLWRHFGLKDNALRIMLPKAVHRYL